MSGGDQETCPKFIPVDHCNALDKLLDYVPNLLDKMMPQVNKKKCECDCQSNESASEYEKEENI